MGIRKFFNKRNWSSVKTRKIMLVMSVTMILTYTIISILFNWFGKSINDQLTIEFFSYCKWLVVTGAAITVAKVFKGNTNSDDDEEVS